MKVLIIDDEADICYLLSTLLKQRNIEATFVHTLADAAVSLKNQMPQIVFLDNHLPDGLGMNFIGYIREHYPMVKIIMITAHDTQIDRSKALQHGVDVFIGKPFTRDLIYTTIDELMNREIISQPGK